MGGKRRWMKAAAALVAAGLLLCGVAMALMGFDLSKLSTGKYETNTYEVGEAFQDIAVRTDTENIAFVPSEDGQCRVVCREDVEAPHRVRVEGDTLTVENDPKEAWTLFRFDVGMDSPSIAIHLPEADYGTLVVDGDTGDVEIPGDFSFQSIRVTLDTGSVKCQASSGGDIAIATDTGRIAASNLTAGSMILASDTGGVELSNVSLAGNLSLRQDTGRATLEAVTCESLASEGNTGDLRMADVVASGEFTLKRDTGSVRFDRCDAAAITVTTDTGSVTGTLLTEKAFIAKSDTGRVEVPAGGEGGRCEITTDTGGIRMEVP